MNEESIRNWVDEEFKSNQDVIEDLRFTVFYTLTIQKILMGL